MIGCAASNARAMGTAITRGQRRCNRPSARASLRIGCAMDPATVRAAIDGRVHEKEHRVVHRRIELCRRRASASATAYRQRPVDTKRCSASSAERHPLRHLQLEMAVVFEPVRVARVHQPRDERRARRSRSAARRADRSRCPTARNPTGRAGCTRLPDARRPRAAAPMVSAGRMIGSDSVSVRGVGIKDVPVEQVHRVGDDLVRDPPDPPDGKQRIAEVRHRIHVQQLIVEQRSRAPPRCRVRAQRAYVASKPRADARRETDRRRSSRAGAPSAPSPCRTSHASTTISE